jgi:hypothetical protein
MRVLIVYESMFGSTRLVADAIAAGLGTGVQVRVVAVAEADTVLNGFDLVVVGGPTHAWGMSWPSTRRAAPIRVQRADGGLALDSGADTGPGVREWLGSLGPADTKAAAFDTRINSRVLFTGQASKRIGRQLARRGLAVVAPPESFLVDKKSHLLSGELERARTWGTNLARTTQALEGHVADRRIR